MNCQKFIYVLGALVCLAPVTVVEAAKAPVPSAVAPATGSAAAGPRNGSFDLAQADDMPHDHDAMAEQMEAMAKEMEEKGTGYSEMGKHMHRHAMQIRKQAKAMRQGSQLGMDMSSARMNMSAMEKEMAECDMEMEDVEDALKNMGASMGMMEEEGQMEKDEEMKHGHM